MFIKRYVSYTPCKQTASFRGQASWARMMSHGGQASSTAMPSDQKVNKAEDLTYLYMTIEKDKQIGKLTYGDSCRQIDRQTDRQSGRYSGRQVYRQPGRLAESHIGLWAGSKEDKGRVW